MLDYTFNKKNIGFVIVNFFINVLSSIIHKISYFLCLNDNISQVNTPYSSLKKSILQLYCCVGVMLGNFTI